MKKIFALTLVLVMCLSFAACGKSNSLIGTWEMEVSVVGMTVLESEQTARLVFDEKGVCTLVQMVNGEETRSEVNYTATDTEITLVTDGREMVCQYEINGDTMTMTAQGMTQTLKRVEE